MRKQRKIIHGEENSHHNPLAKQSSHRSITNFVFDFEDEHGSNLSARSDRRPSTGSVTSMHSKLSRGKSNGTMNIESLDSSRSSSVENSQSLPFEVFNFTPSELFDPENRFNYYNKFEKKLICERKIKISGRSVESIRKNPKSEFLLGLTSSKTSAVSSVMLLSYTSIQRMLSFFLS